MMPQLLKITLITAAFFIVAMAASLMFLAGYIEAVMQKYVWADAHPLLLATAAVIASIATLKMFTTTRGKS